MAQPNLFSLFPADAGQTTETSPAPTFPATGVSADPPMPELDLPIMDWIKARNFHFILCELVLRAKTIEANHLASSGPDAELVYLLEAYEGNEGLLRRDIAEMAAYLHRHTMAPRAGAVTAAMKL